MIEEDIEYLKKEIKQLKFIVSYLAERHPINGRYQHLEYCRNKGFNWDSCSCGATQLNYLTGK